MIDQNTAAKIFFGGTTPSAAAPAAPAATPPAATPATPATKASPEPGSEKSPAEKMFADSPIHGDASRVIQKALNEVDLATPVEAASVAQEWVPIFQTFKLNATESLAMADLGTAVYRNPPSQETRASWANEAKAALVQDFGRENAGQALADAKAWIARDPKLVKFLNDTGLGSHPKLVRLVAAKARAAKR